MKSGGCCFSLRLGAALSLLLAASFLHAEVITFEDLALDPASHYSGPVPGAVESIDPFGGRVYTGQFSSGSVQFGNQFTQYFDENQQPDFSTWSGFAYSNETDQTTAGFSNQFSSFAGADRSGTGDGVFGVAFGYVDSLVTPTLQALQQLPYFTVPQGMVVTGAYLTNITYTALSMQNGDQFGKAFGGPDGTDPDYLRVRAYGVDEHDNILSNSPEFYLADYRSPQNEDDYILDEWGLFDLTGLAGAARIYFNLETSDVGPFGSNTPTYFAIDDISLEPAAVPEPSSALLALAAAGVAWRVRRRKAG